MLIAVTGATGFVGRHITTMLARRGHAVRALVRRPTQARALESLGVELVPGGLADVAALTALTRGANAVVHLVGIIVEASGVTFHAVHVEGTRRVLEAAGRAGVERFVHMSAVGARDEPGATPYHRTKWHAEQLVRTSGLSHALFRPSIISGPESAPIRTLARLHRWSPVVPVFGDGHYPTQPVWVEDVALAFALAVEQPTLSGAFQLGGPPATPAHWCTCRSRSRGRQPLRSACSVPPRRSRAISSKCWSKAAPRRRTPSNRCSASGRSPSTRG